MMLLAFNKPIEIYLQSKPSAWPSQYYVISQGTFIVRNKDKGEAVRVHTMSAKGNYYEPRYYRRSVVSYYKPLQLYARGKSPQCLLNRRLGGSQIRCGRFGEERNLLSLLET